MAIPQNQEEKMALEELRPVVQDMGFGDGVLVRFLRAHGLDIKKAEDMIRKFAVWRVESEINNFQDWIPPEEFYVYDVYFTGFDEEGRAVFWSPLGRWPYARHILDKGMAPDLLRFVGKYMDRVYSLLLKTKHQQFIAIVDLQGITFSKILHETRNWAGIEVLMTLFRDYEANFPELLCSAFMINTPLAFLWGWKFVKAFLSEHTISKINFYGSGEMEKCVTELGKNLGEEVIPPEYGGSAQLTPITHQNFTSIQP